MKNLVVASGNKGKLREIKAILGDRYNVISMADIDFNGEINEDGNTFYENALIKATAVKNATGFDVLADDSGLSVDFLHGAPGVYSARYAGEHGNDKKNRDKLLKDLEGVTDRRAKFVCSMVLVKSDGTIVRGDGETTGKISDREIGDGGFGYDCIFISDDLNKSFGVATDEEKNAVSHRGRAIKDLLSKL